MSFTAEVKDEMSRVGASCPACDKALLAAFIRCEGSLSISGPGIYRLELDTDSSSVARTAIRLFHNLYQVKTELTVRRSVLHKTHNYLIVVPAQIRLADMLEDTGILLNGELNLGIAPWLVQNQCCAAAFLRGAFMSCGFISDPKGELQFEMGLESKELCDDLLEIMSANGLAAKSLQRRNSQVIYTKVADKIVGFLAFTSAHQAALSIENQRVLKSIRNDVNRAVNAELANQNKADAAAERQLKDIDLIERHLGLEQLSPALKDFCELRRSYGNIPSRELGELASPPLSKSGVAHRVQRLEKIAQELRDKGLQ